VEEAIPEECPKYSIMNEIFTWDEFDTAVDKIATALAGKDITSVYGIPRGGLILAICLSHRLGIPLVSNIGEHTLVVDDISDTGKTLVRHPGHMTATIHVAHNTSKWPDVYYQVKETDNWVIYPWEHSNGHNYVNLT